MLRLTIKVYVMGALVAEIPELNYFLSGLTTPHLGQVEWTGFEEPNIHGPLSVLVLLAFLLVLACMGTVELPYCFEGNVGRRALDKL